MVCDRPLTATSMITRKANVVSCSMVRSGPKATWARSVLSLSVSVPPRRFICKSPTGASAHGCLNGFSPLIPDCRPHFFGLSTGGVRPTVPAERRTFRSPAQLTSSERKRLCLHTPESATRAKACEELAQAAISPETPEMLLYLAMRRPTLADADAVTRGIVPGATGAVRGQRVSLNVCKGWKGHPAVAPQRTGAKVEAVIEGPHGVEERTRFAGGERGVGERVEPAMMHLD